MRMGLIREGEKPIYVEQVPHGYSAKARATSSEVISFWPGRFAVIINPVRGSRINLFILRLDGFEIAGLRRDFFLRTTVGMT